MSHISDYVAQVQGVSGLFSPRMPEHQRMVYAVESVVAQVLPSATLNLSTAQRFLSDLCMEVSVDEPELIVKRIGGGFSACASHEHYTIVLSTKTTNGLELCHELAHLMSGKGVGHHEDWRTNFVRLARIGVSVEHGALLHSLYNRCDLPCRWQ